jgi:ferritin heavy chain
MSLAKQNFASQSEEALNQQVNTELQASQVYLSMAAWAQHSSVALPGKKKKILLIVDKVYILITVIY